MADDLKFSDAPGPRKAAKPVAASERPAAASAPDAAASAPTSVTQLDSASEIAARTTDSDEPSDRFVKVFVIPGRDFDVDGPIDDMHRANEVATLSEAINRGLHPKGEARFDGHEGTADGSVRLSYSCHVVLASEDEDPASTVTVRAAVESMGGTTMQDADKALQS